MARDAVRVLLIGSRVAPQILALSGRCQVCLLNACAAEDLSRAAAALSLCRLRPEAWLLHAPLRGDC